ncbi:CxxxxCH/CxxCH domain-containing protein [Geobacter sp.]|uniref:CxxxxCH/CxxCH domain c-type cytochrome n=1 Tax=Geobacter sp. TaxID=46610 RepID=UPI00260EB8DC|nr:CxxxxCH/CxxCH domain-containing protein [Geobacter sp.]
MGRIIVRKVRGLTLRAKGALIIAITLLVTVFMYQGWYRPMLSRASVITYYLNALPATGVGVDGSTTMTSVTDTNVVIGSSNAVRGLMNTNPPSSSARARVYDVSGGTNFTNQEFYRAYTPAYAADTRIEAGVLAEFEAYMVVRGTSASVSVQLFDYNPATGTATQVGTTQTKALSQSTTALQRFTNGAGTAVNFGNAAVKILAGHRLEVRYLVSCTNSQPALLVYAAASTSPSGTSRLITSESVVGDVTVGNGSAEPPSLTIGPSANGNTSYPLDTFSLQLSNSIYDTVDTVTVTLAAGMSQYVGKVLVASTDNSVTYGSLSAPTSGDSWTVPLYGLIPTTSATDYQVRIIPKSYSQLPAAPGGNYAVTGKVTAMTHSQLGNITVADTGSATLTIDNSSPANASWGSVVAGNAQVTLNWSNPGFDFSGVVIIRDTNPAVGHPVKGLSYAAGNTVGTSQVVYVGSGTSFVDTGVANGTGYYYMIHAYDAYYNYAQGVTAGPVAPSNPNMTSLGTPSALGISPTTIRVTMPYVSDPNSNNTYTVRYRKTGDILWTDRIVSAPHVASPYVVDITGLNNAFTYDIQATYNDADGINVEPPTTSYTFTLTAIALPNNATVPGTATAIALGPNSINVDMPYTGDSNGNNTYLVEWQDQASPGWKSKSGSHFASPYDTAIANLTPAHVYDVRMTYSDPDGTGGGQPAQQTVTVTLPAALDNGLLHDSTRFPGTTKWGGNWGTAIGKYGAFTCNVCHQPGASNIKALRSTISAPDGTALPGGVNTAVVFSSITSFGSDAGGRTTSQRVCEACHSQNLYHNFNPSGQTVKNHYNGRDCTSFCHPHDKGFRATCDICHGTPPTTADTNGSTNTGLVWRNDVNGAAPTGATSPASAGAHLRHAGAQPTYRGMLCDTCHHGSDMPNVSKTIQMGFNANGSNVPGFVGSLGYGNFSGHGPLSNGYSFVSGSAGTTVSTGAGYGNSCSVACHGNWSGSGGSVYRPSWVGGPSQAACGACHGATNAVPPSRGSHTTHAGNSAGNYGFACAKCHPSVTDNSHVQGNVRWALNSTDVRIGGGAKYRGANSGGTNAVAPSASYGSCTSLYCHSNGFNAAAPTYRSPTWGNTLDCTGCHGDKTLSPIATGSHTKHVKSFNCGDCHSVTVTSGSTAISDFTTHVNKSVDLKLAALRVVGTATYGGANVTGAYAKTSTGAAGFATCTNVKCHSDGKYVWSGTTPVTKTTPVWGTTDNCYDCHGVGGSFPDYRAAAPQYASSTTAPDKPNAHTYHLDKRATPTGETQCLNCHATVTASNTAIDGTNPGDHGNGTYNVVAGGTFRDGDSTNSTITVTVQHNYAASPGTSTCSNVSCHPVDDSHNRGTSTVAWNNKYICTNCHDIDLQDNTMFHHSMRNYSSGYTTTSPNGDAVSGTNSLSRRCTMCHVDHDKFSPNLNTSNSGGRAYNLRTNISVVPTAGAGYTNADFVKDGTGGICISCHSSAKTKDTTYRRNDTGVTITPAITYNNFTSSSHQYYVPAKFFSDGSRTQSNCSKCHNARENETSLFMNITSSADSFGNHAGGVRRLQGSLGAAGGETAEEQICYRCHSSIAASNPGGGPPKAKAGYDYYGVHTMDAGTEGIYAIMQNNGARNPNPTQSYTNKLYFKPGISQTDYAGASYPTNPMPASPANDGDLGDTFVAGSGAYAIRSMSPWDPTTIYTADIISKTGTQSGTSYYPMVKFVSPLVQATTTVPAGSWVINIFARESNRYLNAKIRYRVYKWIGIAPAAGSKGADIIAKGTYSTELSTAVAPGANLQIAINLGAVTLNAGEKIVVDLAMLTNESSTTNSRVGFYYYGTGAPSNLTLPGMVYWTYGDPGTSGYGHNVQGYVGIHKPSPVDETRAFISANKHVECVDCHNPHALKSGLHTPGNATLATVMRGAYGVGVTTWSSTNWGGVTTYNPSTTTAPLITATAEWQVCFKCHSGANSSVTSWGGSGATAWTDLGLEFNPNNKSGHPVIQSLNNYANSAAPKPLKNTQMKAPWTNVGTQVMTCADCHDSDNATTRGPHGSTVKWMLTGTYKNWPYTTTGGNGGSAGTLVTMGGTSFCDNCHVTTTTGHNANGSWTSRDSAHTGKPCVGCHIRVPHGGKTNRLITGTNAPARYKPDGNGGGTLYLQGIVKWSTTPSKSNCYSTNGSCSDHNSAGSTVVW